MPQRAPAIDAGAVASGAELLVQLQQQLAGGAVGAVNDETPAEAIGFQPDFGTVPLDACGIVLAPGLGPAGGDAAGAFRLDELDAAGLGEGLFDRVHDLHHVALGAARGQLRDRVVDLGDRAPQVGEDDDFCER
jgi:hypothetical protein